MSEKNQNRQIFSLDVDQDTGATPNELKVVRPNVPPRSPLDLPNALLRSPQDSPYVLQNIEQHQPEDEIFEVFRNSDVSHSRPPIGNIIYSALLVGSAVLFFYAAYANKASFRHRVDRLTTKVVGKPLSEIISRPVEGELFKQKEQTEIDAVTDHISPTEELVIPLVVPQIRSGQWHMVEKRMVGTCIRWVASPDCLTKGFYMAHRRILQSVKPMALIPISEASKLTRAEKAVWSLTTAMIVTDRDQKMKLFQDALNSPIARSNSVRRLFYDEILLSLALDKQYGQMSAYISMAEKGKEFPQKELLKYQALHSLGGDEKIRKTALTNLLRIEDQSLLKSDYTTITLLSVPVIKAGLTDRFARIAVDSLQLASKASVDPDILKPLTQTVVRLYLAKGQKNDASSLVSKYTNSFGQDAFSVHYRSVFLMASTNLRDNTLSLNILSSLGQNARWESVYLRGLALVRAGQYTKAMQTAALLEKMAGRSRDGRIWAAILHADIAVGKKQVADTVRVLNRWYSVAPQNVAIADLLRRSYEIAGDDAKARMLRMKIDDVRTKTGYWSSPDVLVSPFGALALAQ